MVFFFRFAKRPLRPFAFRNVNGDTQDDWPAVQICASAMHLDFQQFTILVAAPIGVADTRGAALDSLANILLHDRAVFFDGQLHGPHADHLFLRKAKNFCYPRIDIGQASLRPFHQVNSREGLLHQHSKASLGPFQFCGLPFQPDFQLIVEVPLLVFPVLSIADVAGDSQYQRSPIDLDWKRRDVNRDRRPVFANEYDFFSRFNVGAESVLDQQRRYFAQVRG